MSEEQGSFMDQKDLMKRMKAIASDLWGSVVPGGEEPDDLPEANVPEPEVSQEQDAGAQRRADIRSLWKTADETIDWTDALAHSTPTDGLTGIRMWTFYHKHAEKILAGDLDAYTEVLQKANPLGELTEYAESITMQAPSADRLESRFICRSELMEGDRKLYLAAMGLRIARDLLACLPVEEVTVTGEYEGKEVFTVTFTRMQLMHRNFTFVDPVALSEECGAVFQ